MMFHMRWVLGLIIVSALLGTMAYVAYFRLEGTPPGLTIRPKPQIIGQKTSFTVEAEDGRSGLKRVYVELQQKGKAVPLVEERYEAGTNHAERTFDVVPSSLNLLDGEAVIRAEARDRSWRGDGNPSFLETNVIIDTRPPVLQVQSRLHYVNQGGAGLVVYTAPEVLATSGVRVGERWFPGFQMQDGSYLCFFAVPYDDPPDQNILLFGEDLAQNRSQVQFNYRIRPRSFSKDEVLLSDRFLQRVMPFFQSRYPSLQGDLVGTFKWVNRELRKTNETEIREYCRDSVPKLLWSGSFLRMANSKTMSRFAEHRIYTYRGKEIDRQVHLGVDLASVAMSPVEAANRGMVVFAKELGIYGNAVLLDHGCGLFSMYGHLSRIDVQAGQMVQRGETLGVTGDTGLAGGDHLHFSVLISGTYVNPREWWDPHWIQDNIDLKLTGLTTES